MSTFLLISVLRDLFDRVHIIHRDAVSEAWLLDWSNSINVVHCQVCNIYSTRHSEHPNQAVTSI
jgi:hypothetical protein